MDNLTNWEKLLRKTNYNLYKENFSFDDDLISISSNCNNLESNLGDIRIDISNDGVTSIYNVIKYSDINTNNNFIFIALRNDCDYTKKSIMLKESLKANLINIKEEDIFILEKNKEDIIVNPIVSAKYIIVPQEGNNDTIVYEALNAIRTARKNSIILLIEEADSILIKNSNKEEIKKLKFAVSGSINREIKIIGSYDDIVRSLNNIWDSIYNNYCNSHEAFEELKKIVIERDLSRIANLELLSDKFDNGEIILNINPSDNASILSVKFKRKNVVSNDTTNTEKTYEEEIKEIRNSLLEEYKGKNQTEYKERAYLIQMMRDLSEILK